MKSLNIFWAAILLIFQTPQSFASPAACGRNIVDKFLDADLVVEAKLNKSRRWKDGFSSLYLVGKYQIMEVFKGEVKKDSVQIVTDTCFDEKVPDEMIGYPPTRNYCLGGINLQVTGVDNKTGHPKIEGENSPHWILFLKKDSRPGAPEVTWKEVPEASYYSDCRRTEGKIPEPQLDGLNRMINRQKELNPF